MARTNLPLPDEKTQVLLVNRYLTGAPEVRLATLVDHENPNEPGPADHYMDRGHAILEQ